MKTQILKKIIIGFIVGFIFGLFSTGGGLILVPALIKFFNVDEKKARATSIFCILPIVVMSTFFYARENYINWSLGIKCAIGGCIGGFIGAKILNKIPNFILKIVFAIFLLYIGISMIK